MCANLLRSFRYGRTPPTTTPDVPATLAHDPARLDSKSARIPSASVGCKAIRFKLGESI